MSDNGNEERGLARSQPQQFVGVAAEQQRAIAEIQAALTVAKASPRDEVDAVDRIKVACQRIGLAEKSEYVYNRGGTDIQGPTIDLLTVIANCWGNIQFGFRELMQSNGESTVEAFAWDLETNSKRVVTFTVPHKRYTRTGSYDLTDPRDIYELVANNAQRRVRSSLEAVIPPDVVEDAVAECRRTLQAKAEVNDESIGKLRAAFEKLGVTKEQIEARLGRRLDAMQPAQLVSMRRIFKSISDGMSKAEEWFPSSKVGESDLNSKVGDKPKEPAKDEKKAELKAETKKTEEPKEEKKSEPPKEEAKSEAKPADEQHGPVEKSEGGMKAFLDLLGGPSPPKNMREWEKVKERFIGPKRKFKCTAEEEAEIHRMVKEGLDKVPTKQASQGSLV